MKRSLPLIAYALLETSSNCYILFVLSIALSADLCGFLFLYMYLTILPYVYAFFLHSIIAVFFLFFIFFYFYFFFFFFFLFFCHSCIHQLLCCCIIHTLFYSFLYFFLLYISIFNAFALCWNRDISIG